MGPLVNSYLIEPEVEIVGSIRLKGKRRTGTMRISCWDVHPEGRRKKKHYYSGYLGNV